MSVGLQDQALNDSRPADLAFSVARELHHMAQPLTVLYGLLELSLQQAKTSEDYRRSTEDALAQLQRAMESFYQAQTLLRFAPSQPVMMPPQEGKAQHV